MQATTYPVAVLTNALKDEVSLQPRDSHARRSRGFELHRDPVLGLVSGKLAARPGGCAVLAG